MIRKLKSTSGETITEVLVAALVVVMGVLLYTMMVQSSFRIIKTSDDAMKEMYEAESEIEKNLTPSTEPNATVTFSSDLASDGDGNNVDVILFGDEIEAYTHAEDNS